MNDANLPVYQRPDVVAYYDTLSSLQECEQYVFAKYVKRGMRVLDLGVGGGRTTPLLSSLASEYLGIDYASEMVDVCRKKFPHLKFEQADAARLSHLAADSFDAVVFSFNGIDCLHPATKRLECLAHCRRILARGGLFVFSVHNARALAIRPKLRGAGVVKKAWRIVRAIGKTAQTASRSLRASAFWTGEGYIDDPVHGGLRLHTSTVEHVVSEMRVAGFTLEESVGGNYPAKSVTYAEPWYYYVFRRD